MRIILNIIFLLFSMALILVSTMLFSGLEKLDNTIAIVNEKFNSIEPEINTLFYSIRNKEFRSIAWDSEVNDILAAVTLNISNSIENKGQQQTLLSKARSLYEKSQQFTPRDINSLIGSLNLLTDQGAPLDYLLPRIDQIISLIPKDQDLKADVAMLCFKLLSINDTSTSQAQLINRLNQLFKYSMDYRGMTQVIRNATLFQQQAVLEKLQINVK